MYEGYDRKLGRRVAIKTLGDRFRADKSFRARLSAETRLAAGIRHKNLVAIHDVVVHARVDYIIMEYVEGRTLREIIGSSGPLSSGLAAAIASQVCAALGILHRREIVCRSVTSRNILVGPTGQVTLMDLSIARAGSATQGMTITDFHARSARYGTRRSLDGQCGPSFGPVFPRHLSLRDADWTRAVRRPNTGDCYVHAHKRRSSSVEERVFRDTVRP